jgi:hypothetical protein
MLSVNEIPPEEVDKKTTLEPNPGDETGKKEQANYQRGVERDGKRDWEGECENDRGEDTGDMAVVNEYDYAELQTGLAEDIEGDNETEGDVIWDSELWIKAEGDGERDDMGYSHRELSETLAAGNRMATVRKHGWTAFKSATYTNDSQQRQRKLGEDVSDWDHIAPKQPNKRQSKETVNGQPNVCSKAEQKLLSPRQTKYTAEGKTFLNQLFRMKQDFPKFTYGKILKTFTLVFESNPPRTENAMRNLKDKMRLNGELEGPFPNYEV